MTEDLIFDFCENLIEHFPKLVKNMGELHPDWDTTKLALNLMEFGRGQISEVGEPTDKDCNFYNRYLGSVSMEVKDKALATAYLGGCIMGLVQKQHIKPDQFIQALEYSQKFINEEIGE